VRGFSERLGVQDGANKSLYDGAAAAAAAVSFNSRGIPQQHQCLVYNNLQTTTTRQP